MKYSGKVIPVLIKLRETKYVDYVNRVVGVLVA